jgi:hypothetical protein
MSSSAVSERSSDRLLADFFDAYDIQSIQVSHDADIRDDEASLVDICFDSGGDGYRASFKLLAGAAARIHRQLKAIGPGLELDLTPEGKAAGAQAVAQTLRVFIEAITDRVAKVHREQSILGIQPVGKSFLLYGKTRFEVLSDDGKGRLAIRIMRKDGSSEAGLNANDLLDGLYAGVITRV